MPNITGIFKIYPNTFRVNYYTATPFRMIGLIDVDVIINNKFERLTLGYFRSSGTNSGKVKGLWYPIVGIKLYSGRFTEFTAFINYVQSKTSRNGKASKGWLAKSLFFAHNKRNPFNIRGFSSGTHFDSLLWIGETLRELYEKEEYTLINYLTPKYYNHLLMSNEVYPNNINSQRENFELLVEDIFKNS